MWFWHPKLGWLWTNKDVYPHVWRQEAYAWTYFSRIPDGSFAYYDYTSSSWQSDLDVYEIVVVAYSDGNLHSGGTVSGGGSFKEGTGVTLAATPSEGYVFKRWFGDASGKTPSLNIIVGREHIIYVEFIKSP